MAVYKRSYRPYEGAITPERSRFLVISRAALRELFESRLLTIYVVLCFAPFVVWVSGIYLSNSEAARALLGMRGANTDWIRPEFFHRTLAVQGALAFFLTAWAAPVLVSPDLVNGALPLFLSRPLSRAEYVLGKAGALLTLLSFITWLPLLGMVVLQASLAGGGWLSANTRVVWATFAGAWMWILVLTLLGLAVSAWIRWRLLATGALFGVLFMGAALGEVGHGVLRSAWLRLGNLSYLIDIVWRDLFALPRTGRGGEHLPIWAAWTGLAAACALFVWLLDRRLQAREVVRWASERLVVFENVSKFYGDVLGVNRVSLALPPGVTSLVGPNGSGKTTLMNLLTGLIRPSRGRIGVLGLTADEPEAFFRKVGYCTQFDSFPRGVTGRGFIRGWLGLHGFARAECARLTEEALERTGMTEAAGRKVAGYSKGMRQRIRLAQALSHRPEVLVLDEPLNGLDPMARAESLALFEGLGKEGLHVIVSSHILHEVDRISNHVVLLSHGYVVAEGQIHGVRSEVSEHPIQVLVRCTRPQLLASKLFGAEHVVEVKLHPDGQGLLARTRDAEAFHLLLNRIVLEDEVELEAVAPADDDAHAVYQYLIGSDAEVQ